MSIVGQNGQRIVPFGKRSVLGRERLPESLGATANAVWHSHPGGAVRGAGGTAAALRGQEARQSAYHPPYNGDAPSPRRGGYQHDPSLAGACFDHDDECVRGGRSRDESQSAGELRGQNGPTSKTLA